LRAIIEGKQQGNHHDDARGASIQHQSAPRLSTIYAFIDEFHFGRLGNQWQYCGDEYVDDVFYHDDDATIYSFESVVEVP
jgi:hypothetical protein